MKLPIFYCNDCDLYITGNSDDVEKFSQKIYPETYWKERDPINTKELNYKDGFDEYKTRKWNSQFAYSKPFLKNKKSLLEIGSGEGQALLWFEKLGFSVTGIEPDKNNVKKINSKLQNGVCIEGFVEDINLKKKFDVIWISHVFEHLIKPNDMMNLCKTLLDSDGVIIIEVPDCQNPQTLHGSIHKNPSSFHFTKNSLKKIAQKNGFKILKCDSLRLASKTEGRIQVRKEKYLKFLKKEIFLYYPFFITHKNDGKSIRIILKLD